MPFLFFPLLVGELEHMKSQKKYQESNRQNEAISRPPERLPVTEEDIRQSILFKELQETADALKHKVSIG